MDEQAGIALGHRRLAILDISDAGRQPMESASQRYIVIFNGEIYNHLDIREELARCGAAPLWHGHSDTETLLAAIDAWGLASTLTRLSGMFAFALWDKHKRMLSLARDRMGEKPLYFASVGSQIWFASELKAFRHCDQLELTIDRDAAALFFRFGYVPAPKTIFSGVQKLPPGTFLAVPWRHRGELLPEPYWSLSAAVRRAPAAPALSPEEAESALDALLAKTVRAQMLSDAPLGAFLSGGVDSSLITALMASGASSPIQSFSIGFDETRFNEAHHARAVAEHLGTDHTELIVTERDALDVIPDLPNTFDEPFADSSQIPTALLCRLARKDVTVALSGDGGDELFGGYNRYIMAPKLWDRFSKLPGPARTLLPALAMKLSSGSEGALGGMLEAVVTKFGLHASQTHKLARYGAVLSGSTNFSDVFRKLVEYWPQSEKLVIGAGSATSFLDSAKNWPENLSRAEAMMAIDAVTYLPDDILVKVDRTSMAESLEVRAPFLDRDVVEFAWSLPISQKIGDGRGKQILRNVLDRYVPRHLIDRPKQGFSIPLDNWLRGPLRGWADDLLSQARLDAGGLLQADLITQAWRDHRSGRRQLGNQIWAVLMFEAWRTSFFDAPYPTRTQQDTSRHSSHQVNLAS